MPDSHDEPTAIDERVEDAPIVLRQRAITPFDRGEGVVTLPLVGKWNRRSNRLTTGITRFDQGTGLPLHSHNVEETVLVVGGEAEVIIAGESVELVAGDVTWVPAGVPHLFRNRGSGELSIYWAYGGREITRTITETGVTLEHLSENDRGGIRS